jgi:hypothetical protein
MLRMGAGHHTLTCSACGAPLGRLKTIPVPPPLPRHAISHQPQAAKPRRMAAAPAPLKSYRPRRRRKGMLRWLAEEAFDLVEDIFD